MVFSRELDWQRTGHFCGGYRNPRFAIIGVEFHNIGTGTQSSPHSSSNATDSISGIRNAGDGGSTEMISVPDGVVA